MSTQEREVFAYECQSCEHQFNDGDEGGPLYECGRCGQSYTREDSADGESNRCPNCNIFGGKVADLTCPECQSDEVEHGEFFSPPPPTAEELAVRAEQDAASRAQTDAMMAERDAERDAQRAAWEALDGWTVGVDTADGRLEYTARNFKDGSMGTDLPLEIAERFAATLLDLPVPDELPGYSAPDGEYDAARAAQLDRWSDPDGFARAFAGIDDQGEDLGAKLIRSFGKHRSMGSGISEPAYRAIAELLFTKRAAAAPEQGALS